MLVRFQAALILVVLLSSVVTAQSRFKAGLGINYVSNTYEQPHLYDYFAPSINVNYTLIRASKFGLGIESATSIRISGKPEETNYKTGFTSSVPVIAGLNFNKASIYVGSGPAYVKQTTRESSFNERASGYYLSNMLGVAFGKSAIGDAVYPEYNIRLSFLKSLNKPAYDGGMISFVVFLRG